MFTTGAAAQEFSICLRCQSRLSLGRSIRRDPRRQLRIAAHTRAFSSSVRRRQEDAQPTAGDHSPPARPEIRYVPPEKGTTRISRPPPKRPLGVESMGKPAEVLVMRNKRLQDRDLGVLFMEKPSKPSPPSLEGTSEALLDGIESTRGIIDIDDACANIDSVRKDFLDLQAWKGSQPGQNLESAEEYDGLLLQLVNGFQKKHLAEYWKRSRSTLAVDPLNLFVPYSSDLLARTEWRPTPSSDENISPPPLRDMGVLHINPEQGSVSLLSKAGRWHAETILRNCWKLQRDPGEIGMIALRLRSTYLKLLLGHVSDPLKNLSQVYSVKLDVNKEQNVICVEADFSTCGDVLRALSQILNSIVSTRITLDTNHSTPPRKYMTEVEEWTSTVINREKGTNINEYIVYSLGPEESDLEDVRRLLANGATANATKPNGNVWIKVPVHPTTLAIPQEFGESLPLVARGTQWARFVDEQGRQFGSAPKVGETSQQTELSKAFPYPDLVVNLVHQFLTTRVKSGKFSVQGIHNNWETNLTRWSQIILGQVAFPLSHAKRLEAKLKSAKTNAALNAQETRKSISQTDRVFATTLPGMTRALEAAELSLHPVERLLIRMVPLSARGLSPDLIEKIPELEIIVGIDVRNKTTRLQTARLVLVHRQHDLLLPSHAADLRLVSREYLYCTQEERGLDEPIPSDPALRAFIEESQLDIWGSQKLRTPNQLQLSIPVSSVFFLGKEQRPDHNAIDVDYRFATIEHRTFVSLAPISGFVPEYNTIQAGRTGGRREELAIRLTSQTRSNGQAPGERSTSKGMLEAALQVVGSMRSEI